MQVSLSTGGGPRRPARRLQDTCAHHGHQVQPPETGQRTRVLGERFLKMVMKIFSFSTF